MVKLLLVDACGNYACQCDMFGIHQFMTKRNVDKNGIYLTCAKIVRGAKFFGPPAASVEVFNPLYETPFWHYCEEDKIFELALENLKAVVAANQAPTHSERIIVILLCHGNELGYIKFGTKDIFPEQFLYPLEQYENSRISIITNACFSGHATWVQAINDIGIANGDRSSSVFGHLAADGYSWNNRPSSSGRCDGNIFITNVIRTATPENIIRIHTHETARLTLNDSLSVWGDPQHTKTVVSRESTEGKRTDSFYPEISMSVLIDDEFPQPKVLREGLMGELIDCKVNV